MNAGKRRVTVEEMRRLLAACRESILVAQDESTERGPEAWWWGWPARTVRADTYAYADAFVFASDVAADDDGDAAANAAYDDAYADAAQHYVQQPPQLSTRGLTVRPGLYIYTAPSSESVAVLRVAWLRHAVGDTDPLEYEALNSVTPLRGEYTTLLGDAQDTPPPNWGWSPMLKRPSPIHRAQIRNPVALDPAGWAKVCPRPKDWEER